jgi:hypothetical protein
MAVPAEAAHATNATAIASLFMTDPSESAPPAAGGYVRGAYATGRRGGAPTIGRDAISLSAWPGSSRFAWLRASSLDVGFAQVAAQHAPLR